MESNTMTTYKDQTPAARLDNKTLNKMSQNDEKKEK